ncbi:RNA polymerase sigma factor [Nocardiopsis potens]|uniref:RNA polymerase sigma factor n=1 Tax=Nocardiopsis potens TaxID=1246458 RepID=UPI00034A80AE|nr:sigma factor [Nocardiopsis potens]
MMDRDLALALRSSRPCPTLAYERLYDAYGDELYRLCLRRLDDPDKAQAVLRDTFIVAGAHIHRLADSGRLREWLAAIARAECEHHLPPNGADRGAESAAAVPQPCASEMRAPEKCPVGVRLRVLSGLVGPDLEGHREHVAVRAAGFDRDGFPLPAPERGRPGLLRTLLPAAAVAACALLLVMLAVYVFTRTGPEEPPSWSGLPSVSLQR